jgi:hypothetical protein
MHNQDFGQEYWKDLLKGIPENFTLYFSEFAMIFYNFLEFSTISWNNKSGEDFWKTKKLVNSNGLQTGPTMRPQGRGGLACSAAQG